MTNTAASNADEFLSTLTESEKRRLTAAVSIVSEWIVQRAAGNPLHKKTAQASKASPTPLSLPTRTGKYRKHNAID